MFILRWSLTPLICGMKISGLYRLYSFYKREHAKTCKEFTLFASKGVDEMATPFNINEMG